MPDSNYDGLSKVTVNAMPTGILDNPTINNNGLITATINTSGYLSSGTNKTLQLSTQGSKTITPSRYSQTAISSGTYATGAVIVSGSSNLAASNIKNGVNIFGVTGTYAGENIEQYFEQYYIHTEPISQGESGGELSSSPFKPRIVIFYNNGKYLNNTDMENIGKDVYMFLMFVREGDSGTKICSYTTARYKVSSDQIINNHNVVISNIDSLFNISWRDNGIVVESLQNVVFYGQYEIIAYGSY